MNVLVIFTYPGIENFLSPLVQSVNHQSRKDFSVVFVNDRLPDLEDYLEDLKAPYEIFSVAGTPYKNRISGLKRIREMDVENLFFQDADDLMAPNRIEECIKYLEQTGFVVNDQDLINPKGELSEEKYWSSRLNHGFLFDHTFIARYNLLGFTNTSFKGELLNYLPEFRNEEIVAADWFIFYQILYQSGANVRFINSATSQYRQHSQNITGLGGLSESRLRRTLDVKRKHYKSLIEAGYNFEDELNRILRLEKKTKHKFKKNRNPHLFWWEETEYVYQEN